MSKNFGVYLLSVHGQFGRVNIVENLDNSSFALFNSFNRVNIWFCIVCVLYGADNRPFYGKYIC